MPIWIASSATPPRKLIAPHEFLICILPNKTRIISNNIAKSWLNRGFCSRHCGQGRPHMKPWRRLGGGKTFYSTSFYGIKLRQLQRKQ